MSFWGELRRRNVVKVAVAYAIVAWLLIQIAGAILPTFDAPRWVLQTVTFLLILGLPIALILAWAYAITPGGIKPSAHVDSTESVIHVTGQKLNYIAIGLLVLAVAFMFVDNYMLEEPDPDVIVRETVSPIEDSEIEFATEAVAGAERPDSTTLADSPRTIAVLAFLNLSSDPEQDYFADGLTEELLNSLAQIRELRVTARTSSFAFKQSGQTAQEIAAALDVDHILEGSVRKAGNTLRIQAQLILAEDQSQLWSNTYNRELEDVFAIQEDIAMAVADELSATLGLSADGGILGGTADIEAFELYLAALDASRASFDLGGLSYSLELLDAAIELDPNFALAWSEKSAAHSSLVQVLPRTRVAQEQDAAEQAAIRAINLEPNLGVAHAKLGYASSQRRKWIEAEKAYRRAEELGFANTAGSAHGILLMATGDFSRAREVDEIGRSIDPLNPVLRAFLLLSQGLDGAVIEAFEEFERGQAIYNEWALGDTFMLWLRLGNGDIDSADEIALSGPINEAAKLHFDAPDQALIALRELSVDDANANQPQQTEIAMWAAYFGDPRFAFETMQGLIARNTQTLYAIWLPQMAAVRQLPEFKALIRDVGFIEYWNEFGWPDICRPLNGDDFICG